MFVIALLTFISVLFVSTHNNMEAICDVNDGTCRRNFLPKHCLGTSPNSKHWNFSWRIDLEFESVAVSRPRRLPEGSNLAHFFFIDIYFCVVAIDEFEFADFVMNILRAIIMLLKSFLFIEIFSKNESVNELV